MYTDVLTLSRPVTEKLNEKVRTMYKENKKPGSAPPTSTRQLVKDH